MFLLEKKSRKRIIGKVYLKFSFFFYNLQIILLFKTGFFYSRYFIFLKTINMKIYSFEKKQNFPVSVQTAWNFLSDPNNLKKITPDYMGFNIISSIEKEMYSGQIIQYTVRPLFGIPFKWVTEITHVEKNRFFVDEQRFGPYSFWHHKHYLKPIKGGVEMRDVIHYKLPFGVIGQIIHPIVVKPKLKEIFDYRKKILNKFFGNIKN